MSRAFEPSTATSPLRERLYSAMMAAEGIPVQANQGGIMSDRLRAGRVTPSPQ